MKYFYHLLFIFHQIAANDAKALKQAKKKLKIQEEKESKEPKSIPVVGAQEKLSAKETRSLRGMFDCLYCQEPPRFYVNRF